ncbi:Pkinase-domain-containing protein [Delitschia confertaspora ATCC 74209]|uniref:cyclin-dependent kinase n=1 Tax=Delitschia confertaspora ATCC 74209 TaxID=1513339 RepID=A0A9P4JQP6_9PLEO|nr:Pkinase-domain-containing protein [Delitschia confertaspora ATCC 74209]
MDKEPKWMSITGEPLDLENSSSFLGNCSSIKTFEAINTLGEGAYGVVTRSRDIRDSSIVAIKQLHILPSERHNGIPVTALREISILRSLRHENIINVLDVAASEERLEDVYMVMEYCEQDLASLMDDQDVRFKLSEVKCLAKQLLSGLEYIHRNDIIHRDVKLENILLTGKGILKLADFGMSRQFERRPLSPGVVTIWYRAPEILLESQHYGPVVDLWSAGLIIGELLLNEPILPGDNSLHQLSLIVMLLGTPEPEGIASLETMRCEALRRWQREEMSRGRPNNLNRKFAHDTTEGTVKFLGGLLRWDPNERWTATEALGKGKHPPSRAVAWWEERPRPVSKDMLPTFRESRNEEKQHAREPKQFEVEVRGGGKHAAETSTSEFGGYSFDFGDDASASKAENPHKKRRR